MKMQGAHASGTTWVEFDEVKVPVENLVGKEGEGFRYVVSRGRRRASAASQLS